LNRRQFLQRGAAALAAVTTQHCQGQEVRQRSAPSVQTVLGPIPASELGATLMHEHIPLVDWSELHGSPAADISPVRKAMIAEALARLKDFRESLPDKGQSATVVECTPIRVGRYPQLLVDIARQTPVHIVACTGFWCEALAPQHPWARQLIADPRGLTKLTELYIREIRQGMEDPTAGWGERFTDVKAGIIKVATSTQMTAGERRLHEAAAAACSETGCAITTHTTEGGGLEQARLLIERGALPSRIIIGHQGYRDDRQHDLAGSLHEQLADLGCYVQFDRVGHPKYPIDPLVKQIKQLVDKGFGERVLVAHDHVPYFYERAAQPGQPAGHWQRRDEDFTVVTRSLLPALLAAGVTSRQVQDILVHNPARALAMDVRSP
jgi:phosphotriesterase-related protein